MASGWREQPWVTLHAVPCARHEGSDVVFGGEHVCAVADGAPEAMLNNTPKAALVVLLHYFPQLPLLMCAMTLLLLLLPSCCPARLCLPHSEPAGMACRLELRRHSGPAHICL
jgi:hypothetical protein